MASQLSILGFAGSLRKGSFNKAILRAALEMAAPEAKLEVFDLEGIPLFNQDLENQPAARVSEFKKAIRTADALLIATPEYNYSMPGVLKNALDCASRPYGDNAGWETRRNHGCFHRYARHRESAVSFAPELRLFEHVSVKSSGSDGALCGREGR